MRLAEAESEDQNEQGRSHKAGDAGEEGGAYPDQPVHHPAGPRCRDKAAADPDDKCQHHRQRPQGERNRKSLGHQFGHREVAIDKARPEIALRQIGDIGPHLHGQRLIQPVSGHQCFAGFGRERPLPIKGSAGRKAHQQEG
jgi:hypothetical protein